MLYKVKEITKIFFVTDDRKRLRSRCTKFDGNQTSTPHLHYLFNKSHNKDGARAQNGHNVILSRGEIFGGKNCFDSSLPKIFDKAERLKVYSAYLTIFLVFDYSNLITVH